MLEHFFQCPYCWEEVSMMLDPSVGAQTYVEDCEVCCNPMELKAQFVEGQLQIFSAEPLGQ